MLTCLAIYQQKAVQYFPVFAHADRNWKPSSPELASPHFRSYAYVTARHLYAANADTFNGVFSTLRPIASVWE